MCCSTAGRHADINIVSTSPPGDLVRPQLCPREQPTASGAQEDKSDGGYQGPHVWDEVNNNNNNSYKSLNKARTATPVKLFTLCSWVIMIMVVGDGWYADTGNVK